jgi:hypothetical protein
MIIAFHSRNWMHLGIYIRIDGVATASPTPVLGHVWFVAKCATLCLRLVVRIE